LEPERIIITRTARRCGFKLTISNLSQDEKEKLIKLIKTKYPKIRVYNQFNFLREWKELRR
jgi:hypothetical protein